MHLLEQAEFARQDFAKRRGTSPESVSVMSVRPVTWRSGALGCPEPGLSYTEALVPGVHILVRGNDEIAAYHAGVGGEPFLCPKGRAELPLYGADSDQI
jgi:hypothetical protein